MTAHYADDLAKLREEVEQAEPFHKDTALAAPPSTVSWQEALEKLKRGNARYARGENTLEDYNADRAALAESQAPFAAIVSCADSRVAPELTFSRRPGELFVCRVAGNIVNMDVLASLEYAVGFLGTKLIFVMGHTNCGAVDAGIKVFKHGAELPGHIQELAVAITPAVARVQGRFKAEELLAPSVKENVKMQMARLATRSVILSEGIESGAVGVAGGVYHLHSGEIEFLDTLA